MLMYLPFDKNADKHRCKGCVQKHWQKYTIRCLVIHIQKTEEAQNVFTPCTTFSLFYDSQFITHEILSEKNFEKIMKSCR